jgi:hypothetical protein
MNAFGDDRETPSHWRPAMVDPSIMTLRYGPPAVGGGTVARSRPASSRIAGRRSREFGNHKRGAMARVKRRNASLSARRNGWFISAKNRAASKLSTSAQRARGRWSAAICNWAATARRISASSVSSGANCCILACIVSSRASTGPMKVSNLPSTSRNLACHSSANHLQSSRVGPTDFGRGGRSVAPT